MFLSTESLRLCCSREFSVARIRGVGAYPALRPARGPFAGDVLMETLLPEAGESMGGSNTAPETPGEIRTGCPRHSVHVHSLLVPVPAGLAACRASCSHAPSTRPRQSDQTWHR